MGQPYNHKPLFFGNEETPNLPPQLRYKKWTGYTLGYTIAALYMKEAGKNASQLVTTPAPVIAELWLKGRSLYVKGNHLAPA